MTAGGAEVVVFDDNDKSVAEAKAAGLNTQDLRELDWSRIAALVLAPGVPLTHPEAALVGRTRAQSQVSK